MVDEDQVVVARKISVGKEFRYRAVVSATPEVRKPWDAAGLMMQ
jgi:hypothetical protein